jgi:hypothetical protein
MYFVHAVERCRRHPVQVNAYVRVCAHTPHPRRQHIILHTYTYVVHTLLQGQWRVFDKYVFAFRQPLAVVVVDWQLQNDADAYA